VWIVWLLYSGLEPRISAIFSSEVEARKYAVPEKGATYRTEVTCEPVYLKAEDV
jgi:hypothetical protein